MKFITFLPKWISSLPTHLPPFLPSFLPSQSHLLASQSLISKISSWCGSSQPPVPPACRFSCLMRSCSNQFCSGLFNWHKPKQRGAKCCSHMRWSWLGACFRRAPRALRRVGVPLCCTHETGSLALHFNDDNEAGDAITLSLNTQLVMLKESKTV